MGVILGLAAALLYGGSDFVGGLTSRKLGALPVNVVGSSAAHPDERQRRHLRTAAHSRTTAPRRRSPPEHGCHTMHVLR